MPAAADLERFVAALLEHHDAAAAEAAAVARALVWSDLVGRPNQGVSRLDILVRRLNGGLIRSPCNADERRLQPGLIRIDGNGGFGHWLGALAMDAAVDAAREHGIAAAVVADSNYFGAAGYYAWRAAEAGMIGIAMSNSFAKVAAHGGVQAVLGTNPLAVGVPRTDGRHLLLDMSTASTAGSTVRELAERGSQLPDGAAVRPDGTPLTDPAALGEGALLPFGGARGYGLALVVEVLCGVLSGAAIGTGVGSMYNDFQRSGNNGQFMLAIDVSAVLGSDLFGARMESLIEMLRASSRGGEPAVRYPGETRWAEMARQQREGITLSDPTREALERLAGEASLRPPWR